MFRVITAFSLFEVQSFLFGYGSTFVLLVLVSMCQGSILPTPILSWFVPGNHQDNVLVVPSQRSEAQRQSNSPTAELSRPGCVSRGWTLWDPGFESPSYGLYLYSRVRKWLPSHAEVSRRAMGVFRSQERVLKICEMLEVPKDHFGTPGCGGHVASSLHPPCGDVANQRGTPVRVQK